jgi:hypothetical protein
VIFNRIMTVVFACALLTNMQSLADASDLSREKTLCTAEEDIYFSCELDGAHKVASVCAAENASPDAGYVQYGTGLDQYWSLNIRRPSGHRGTRCRSLTYQGQYKDQACI